MWGQEGAGYGAGQTVSKGEAGRAERQRTESGHERDGATQEVLPPTPSF